MFGAAVAAGVVRKVDGRWYVQRTTAQGFTRREGEIEVRPMVGPFAYVGFRAASTVGDPESFSSDRLEVSLSMPAYLGEIDDVFSDVVEWVGRRMVDERNALVEMRAERRSA